MKAVAAIVGEGLLADFVYRELSDRYTVVRQSDFAVGVPETVKLVLVVHDEKDTDADLRAEKALRQAGIPWLRAYASSGEGVVGPLVRPNAPGCSQCADNRHFMAGRDPMEMSELVQLLMRPEERPPEAAVSRSGLWQIAHLIAAEAHRVLQGGRAKTEEHLYLIKLDTLRVKLHFFQPDPLCQVCGRLPDDSSAAAQIILKPRPKLGIESYRSRSIDDLNEVLVKNYLDPQTGLFNEKFHDLKPVFASVNVNMPSIATGDEVSGGRSHSYAESELTAILEGLERYCGLTPRGKRTVIHDSYLMLADQALDPVKVGVHKKEQYAQPDFPFEPFDPERPIDWVWGYSFLQERPLLVPQLLAYYSLNYGGGFVQEGSNGCALGGSLEEAIFYGILEVVERDSFLMTWYARLPVPRLDPYSSKDRELQLMVERLRAIAGYEVYLFNTTMENGIPSILALAKSDNPQRANLICAAGAHLDPVRAAKSAIHELAGMLGVLQEKFETKREELEQMLHDRSLVQQMEDHFTLYSLPQAEERLQFLLDTTRPLRTFDDEFEQKRRHPDLTDDLKDIIRVFRSLSLDVIVVDQSSPETLRNGLHCAKVLIPGMLPMTFGHDLTRLTGLERVLRVPMELGYANQLLTIDDLNPHPHPFP